MFLLTECLHFLTQGFNSEIFSGLCCGKLTYFLQLTDIFFMKFDHTFGKLGNVGLYSTGGVKTLSMLP